MATAKLLIFLATSCVLVLCVHCAPQSPVPSKVRQTRGFRNSALATARGFGKRTYPDSVDLLMSDGASISVPWLSEQMSKNPELAQLIVERYVDANGDGQVTMDELSRKL